MVLIALILAFALTLTSCSAAISDEAFAAQITRIDQLMLSGSTSSALRRLNKLSKKTISVPQRLGVYRRLVNGGSVAGEACLTEGLKTNNASPELNAVYVRWLQSQGRREDALFHSEFLTGTGFESLRSELLLADGTGALSPEGYEAAYTVTGNRDLLQNAGLSYARRGDYAAAARLAEMTMLQETPNSLFWARILMDAGQYEQACDFLQENQGESAPARLERLLLLQDSLDCLGDVKGAQEVREEILAAFDAALVPPVVYYNRARDAEGEGDAYTWGHQLDTLVQNYPDYVPGLAALAHNALSRIPPRPDATGLEGDLEARGLQSRGMAEEARIVHFEAPAVLERMEASLKRHPDSPDLLAEYFKLSRQVENARGQAMGKQNPLLWTTLERLNPAKGECPPLLAHYAVSSLLIQGHYRDARRVFEQYKQGREPKEPWEKECAAYFAAQDGEARTALTLYSSLIEGEQALMPDGAAHRTYQAPLGVHINYTLVLAGAGQYRKAVSYCRRTMERVTDPSRQADLAFFLAELQIETQENADAIRTLEYCLLLKPEHQQARVLLRKLRG